MSHDGVTSSTHRAWLPPEADFWLLSPRPSSYTEGLYSTVRWRWDFSWVEVKAVSKQRKWWWINSMRYNFGFNTLELICALLRLFNFRAFRYRVNWYRLDKRFLEKKIVRTLYWLYLKQLHFRHNPCPFGLIITAVHHLPLCLMTNFVNCCCLPHLVLFLFCLCISQIDGLTHFFYSRWSHLKIVWGSLWVRR